MISHFWQDLALSMVSLLPLAMAAPVYHFLKRHWHPDAVRFHAAIVHTQRAVIRSLLAGGTIAVLGRLNSPEDMLGLLPLIFLELGPLDVVSMGVTLGCLGWSLRAGWNSWSFTLTCLGLATVLALTGIPSTSGYAWLLTWISWIAVGRFLWFKVLENPPPIQVNEWIRRWPDRGAQLATWDQVDEHHRRQRSLRPNGSVYFGFTLVPADQAEGHFLIAGATGSGKTILFRLLMQSVLPQLGTRVHGRAVIFDSKREQVSVLEGLGLTVPVTILNPFDARGRVWDLSEDIQTPSDALQLARLLLPDEEGSKEDPFWRKTARGVLADLIRAHILACREEAISDWSLPDIIRALASKDALERGLNLHPSTAHSLRNLGEERILFGVLAQIDLVRREFEVLAALWQDALGNPDRLFSLTEWMGSDGILVLGTAASDEEVLKPLNRLLLDRVGQLLLDLPERPHAGQEDPVGRTWLLLDEFPRLGRTTRMPVLMTNGRSKGLVAVIGIQDIADLQETYGPRLSEIIAGSCSHQLQLEAPTDSHAEWAEKQIAGSQDVTTLSRNISFQTSGSPQGNSQSTGWSASEKTRPLFSRDEIRNLGKPGIPTPVFEIPGWAAALSSFSVFSGIHQFSTVALYSPIRAICRVQGQIYQAELPFFDAIEALSPKSGDDFLPRPVEDQFLSPQEPEEEPPPLAIPESRQTSTKAAILAALRSILPARNPSSPQTNSVKQKSNP
jgi:hypothetical protein